GVRAAPGTGLPRGGVGGGNSDLPGDTEEGGRCVAGPFPGLADGEASSTATTGMSGSLATPRFCAGGVGIEAGACPGTPSPPKSNVGVGDPVVGMRRCAGGVGVVARCAPGVDPGTPNPGVGTAVFGLRGVAFEAGARTGSGGSTPSIASKSNGVVSGACGSLPFAGFRGNPDGRGVGEGLSGGLESLTRGVRVRVARGRVKGDD
ncbi:MAG: hypothetical protein K8T20_02680, partial [Planctomycetes bacterium]|nr:hypothetical protein [Planctomycetota bacterium]